MRERAVLNGLTTEDLESLFTVGGEVFQTRT